MTQRQHAARDEISESWQRSQNAGLTPERFEVPYAPEIDPDDQLLRAAGPVLEQLVDDLASTNVSVVLTDEDGHLVDRRVPEKSLQHRLDRISLAPGFVYAEDAVGTNAIGTALERRAPSFVQGEEHFAEALTDMACAAAPIVDPLNGHVLGVVDLTCQAEDSSTLMLPFVTRTAREIEARLVDATSVADRIALQQFLRARRGAKGALVYVDGRTMMTNAAADRLVAPTDEATLWGCACRAIADGLANDHGIVLSRGVCVTMRCEPVLDGGVVVGALIRLAPVSAPDSDASRRARNAFGWDSLTETERSVTALVSQGLSNAEVAGRLFVSRHTVDYHLRAIFRKLDVGSRVDLTRLAVQHDNVSASPD